VPHYVTKQYQSLHGLALLPALPSHCFAENVTSFRPRDTVRAMQGAILSILQRSGKGATK